MLNLGLKSSVIRSIMITPYFDQFIINGSKAYLSNNSCLCQLELLLQCIPQLENIILVHPNFAKKIGGEIVYFYRNFNSYWISWSLCLWPLRASTIAILSDEREIYTLLMTLEFIANFGWTNIIIANCTWPDFKLYLKSNWLIFKDYTYRI